jgi:hypothetical protein
MDSTWLVKLPEIYGAFDSLRRKRLAFARSFAVDIQIRSRRNTRVGIAIAMWIALAISGCRMQGPALAPLKVQVFIPTAGGANVTLGLVSVAAAPLDRVSDTITAHYQRVDAELALLRDRLDNLQNEEVKAEAVIEQCSEEIAAGRAAISRQEAVLTRSHANPFEWPEYLQAITSMSKAMVTKREEMDAIAVKLRSDGKDDDATEAKETSARLNDTVREIKELMARQIVGRDLAARRQLVREHEAFYSRDLFQECAEQQRAVLVQLDAIRAFLEEPFAIEQDAITEKRRLERIVSEASARQAEAESVRQAAIRQRTDVLATITAVSSSANLFESLGDAVVTKQTDPDGVAILELDSRVRWVLWATAYRLLAGESNREQYFWVVEAPPATEWKTTSPYFLSSHNLLGGRPSIAR